MSAMKPQALVASAVTVQGYRKWIAELKTRYRATQIKAAISVNAAMLEFYWDLGRDIAAMYPGKRRNAHFFESLSNDLRLDIPNPVGLSPSNIRYALRFYDMYSYLQQVAEDNPVADLMKVPWGHHILLLGKCKGDRDKALFYVRKAIEGGWSRTDLSVAISERLYEKTGKAATNFTVALPQPDGYLANELVKSEYSFALTEMVDSNNERQIEAALVRNITRTLTELGGGFAYVGHQVRVNVGGEDFWPDLIFYHLKSRRYLVIELKATGFKPEHIGQLGFYMEAVDRQIKNEWDAPTIGLLLCREGNRTVVEYALSITGKPMGVARYKLTQRPPKEIAEIKKAVDKLEIVVDEIFMESKTKSNRGPASKGKEVPNG